MSTRYFGAPIPRLEDPRLLTGRGEIARAEAQRAERAKGVEAKSQSSSIIEATAYPTTEPDGSVTTQAAATDWAQVPRLANSSAGSG